MTNIKCVFMVMILFISAIPLYTMWIVSVLLEGFAKALDNIVSKTCEEINKKLDELADE